MRTGLLLLALPPLALVACGSSRSATTPAALKLVRDAILKTAGAPSMHFTADFADSQTSQGGSGDLDNARHVISVVWSDPPRTRLVIAPGVLYARDGKKWDKVVNASTVSVFVPLFVSAFLRNLEIERVVKVQRDEFRVWTKELSHPVDIQLAPVAGYVNKLRYVEGGTTIRLGLSRFGERLNLTVPPASEVRS